MVLLTTQTMASGAPPRLHFKYVLQHSFLNEGSHPWYLELPQLYLAVSGVGGHIEPGIQFTRQTWQCSVLLPPSKTESEVR